jgi:thiamine biosynthesis lipoprotein
MREKKSSKKLNRNIGRRDFLKACGALGVGAIAGGLVQAKWDVAGIGRRLKKVSRTDVAMGTFVTVTAVHDSRDLAQEAIGRAFEDMDRLIAVFNRYDPASPVSVLNRDGRLGGAPPELTDVLRWAGHFNQISNGSFDVTVKPLIDLFDATVGRDGRTFPRDDQIAEAAALVDASGVRTADGAVEFARPGMGVTLDGIAKGYIVDMMSASLAGRGVENHLVNAGGDIRTGGRSVSGEAWTIAVEDPRKRREYPDVIRMTDGAVATSGNYEIYYDKEKLFHHVVDPRSGRSPGFNVSATVRAASVMVADALSTATFVVEPDAGVRMVESAGITYGAQALILDAGGTRRVSKGWASGRA